MDGPHAGRGGDRWTPLTDTGAPSRSTGCAPSPPPTPAAPNVVPFRPRTCDRAAPERRIGAPGGAATVARHGTAHMASIGKAGARTTIDRHGVAFFRGIVAAKGWAGPRTPRLPADLAAGRWLADLAA